MNTIAYYCPDISVPVGGIRRLYHHVEVLAKSGYAAFVLHKSSSFNVTWITHSAPVRHLDRGMPLGPGDVLVIPETCTDVLRSTQNAPFERVVMALSWYFIYLGMKPGENYASFGVRKVIAGSGYIRRFISESMKLESTVLSPGNDLDLFRPCAEKKLQIVCMPRKNPSDLHLIECIFRSAHPEHRAVSFIRMDQMPHHEVARILGESAIFLATGYPEGIARPPLEAMASACIVVGFHGRGSLEYMEHGKNCFCVDDGDVLAAAHFLHEAIRSVSEGSADAMRAAAVQTAARYSYEIEAEAVLKYWKGYFEERSQIAASASGA
jgi:hypothetical protein